MKRQVGKKGIALYEEAVLYAPQEVHLGEGGSAS